MVLSALCKAITHKDQLCRTSCDISHNKNERRSGAYLVFLGASQTYFRDVNAVDADIGNANQAVFTKANKIFKTIAPLQCELQKIYGRLQLCVDW